MKNRYFIGMLPFSILLSSCASGPAHLDPAHAQRFGAKSVAVIYVERVEPLHPMLSIPPQGGEIHMMHLYDAFAFQLNRYQDAAKQLRVQDLVYDSLRASAGAAPWLKGAKWSRVQRRDASDYDLPYAEQASADVIVVLDTRVDVYSYLEKVSVKVSANIYTKPSLQDYRAINYLSADLTRDGDLGNAGTEGDFGFPDATDPLPDEEVEKRLDGVFGGGGRSFMSAINAALRPLQPSLTYFLTGTGPIPATD